MKKLSIGIIIYAILWFLGMFLVTFAFNHQTFSSCLWEKAFLHGVFVEQGYRHL
jgi:hypothetical protein